MKKLIAASAMALALVTTASAEMKVGVGLNIADVLNGNGGATIRVPLDGLVKDVRIEPELGFGSGTDKGGSIDLESSYFTLACGGYYTLWNIDKVNIYTGGRFAINTKSSETPNGLGGTNSQSGTGFSLQGLFGAEYFLVEQFSVAAQAGIEMNNDKFNSGFGTVGHVVLRYFFLPTGR